MNKLIKHAFIIMASISFSGCLSTDFSSSELCVYAVKDVNHSNTDINFTFTNLCEKTVDCLKINLELSTYDDNGFISESYTLETQVYETVLPFQEIKFSIPLSDLKDRFDCADDELYTDFLEGNVCITRLFPKEIIYTDNSLWKDQFGDWSF